MSQKPLEDGDVSARERGIAPSDDTRTTSGDSLATSLRSEAVVSLSGPQSESSALAFRPSSNGDSLTNLVGNLELVDSSKKLLQGRTDSLSQHNAPGLTLEQRVQAIAAPAKQAEPVISPADVQPKPANQSVEVVTGAGQSPADVQPKPANQPVEVTAGAGQSPTDSQPAKVEVAPSKLEVAPLLPEARPVKSDLLKSERGIADQIADGNFKISDLKVEKRAGEGKYSPVVKVGFENRSGNETMKPDFIVRKDGSVEVSGDPQKLLKQNDISIRVERGSGQLHPTDAQKEAVDALTKYLATQIKQQYPRDQKNGIKLHDVQNLVSPQAEKEMGARNVSELSRLPAVVRKQIEEMNRFEGGGGGRMSRRDSDRYFPGAEGRPNAESQRLEAMKDVVGGFNSRGSRPYENVGRRQDRGHVVGRYGLGYDQVSNWLESKNPQELADLERAGKLPKGSTDRMMSMKESIIRNRWDPTQPLDPFLEKMKNADRRNPLSAKELKAVFGKELQDVAATDIIRKYAQETLKPNGQVDIGKVALAMQLGRVPTDADMARRENKSIVRAANQAYSLAETRRLSPGSADIDWTDVNGRTLAQAQAAVGKVMWHDFARVVKGGRLGCAASVSKVLEHTGIHGIKSAGVKDFADRAVRAGYERLPLSQARPGDIVYGTQPGTSGTGGRAHIGIVGTDGKVYHNKSSTGRWKEDNLQGVFTNRRFGRNLWVLRAPSDK